MNSPLIKWTGSKRPIAKRLTNYFPHTINTYYEPFLGGGSVFFELLKSNTKVNKYVLSDINESLIGIFNTVKESPTALIDSYKEYWAKLQEDPDLFYNFRTEYNQTKNPLFFYFLTRTCYNGTIRYNSKGEFNTSFHFGRKGMNPKRVAEIIMYYHELMKDKDITFNCSTYEFVKPTNKDDIVYLDPPYTNTKALYFGNIDFNNLMVWIDNLPCNWYMNLNGVNGQDNEKAMPIEFTDKVLINSGNSSFSRMKGKSVNVEEYFYYKEQT